MFLNDFDFELEFRVLKGGTLLLLFAKRFSKTKLGFGDFKGQSPFATLCKKIY